MRSRDKSGGANDKQRNVEKKIVHWMTETEVGKEKSGKKKGANWPIMEEWQEGVIGIVKSNRGGYGGATYG